MSYEVIIYASDDFRHHSKLDGRIFDINVYYFMFIDYAKINNGKVEIDFKKLQKYDIAGNYILLLFINDSYCYLYFNEMDNHIDAFKYLNDIFKISKVGDRYLTVSEYIIKNIIE